MAKYIKPIPKPNQKNTAPSKEARLAQLINENPEMAAELLRQILSGREPDSSSK